MLDRLCEDIILLILQYTHDASSLLRICRHTRDIIRPIYIHQVLTARRSICAYFKDAMATQELKFLSLIDPAALCYINPSHLILSQPIYGARTMVRYSAHITGNIFAHIRVGPLRLTAADGGHIHGRYDIILYKYGAHYAVKRRLATYMSNATAYDLNESFHGSVALDLYECFLRGSCRIRYAPLAGYDVLVQII